MEGGDGYNVVGPEVGGGQVESHYHTIMLPFHPHPHPCKIAITRYEIQNTKYKIQNIKWNHITIPSLPSSLNIRNSKITQVKITQESHHSTFPSSLNVLNFAIIFISQRLE